MKNLGSPLAKGFVQSPYVIKIALLNQNQRVLRRRSNSDLRISRRLPASS